MTPSFEWAGLASVMVSGTAPLLAALVPVYLERRRISQRARHIPAGDGQQTQESSDSEERTGVSVRIAITPAQGDIVTISVVKGPAAVAQSTAKERAPW
ncbi:hypothetical protein OG883_40805 [Streptomyces sp. NBC_01142]|uniref:hypothetical protein n=1 Tax=Streptomyces sp. NBC_01142 TaxID=2975865 RepID=UPI002250CBF0|nr:hypothetical protein [Streptomyces sp. NBC_01142]MCX4826017.1 hypothetical protein [Streptomyces sp. NBC_01142]